MAEVWCGSPRVCGSRRRESGWNKELEGRPGMASVHDGEVPNGGNVEVVHGGHGMVAAAPWIPGQRERVHKGEQKKRNSKVKEWKRKRDGVSGNLPRKLAGLGRRTQRSSLREG